MYVRVRDKDTKHQFDVPEGDKRIGGALELVKKPHYAPSRYPRPPKYHLSLAGGSAGRSDEGPGVSLPAVAGSADGPEVGENVRPSDG